MKPEGVNQTGWFRILLSQFIRSVGTLEVGTRAKKSKKGTEVRAWGGRRRGGWGGRV